MADDADAGARDGGMIRRQVHQFGDHRPQDPELREDLLVAISLKTRDGATISRPITRKIQEVEAGPVIARTSMPRIASS